MAIASLVIGIVSILTLSCGLVGAIPGIVFGIMAHSKATKQPLEYGGKGIALAGIITSVTSIPLGAILGIVAAIVVPRYMKPVEIASETSIIIRLEEISLAEYKLYDKTHRYGTLQDLEAAGLLDSSAPVPVGYKVAVRTTSNSFEALATPEQGGPAATRQRSFYVTTDYVVRGAYKDGREANGHDPPIHK